jgi:hypothetical protein
MLQNLSLPCVWDFLLVDTEKYSVEGGVAGQLSFLDLTSEISVVCLRFLNETYKIKI